MDREQELARAIETGKITDRDILDIQDHGSRSLRYELEKKTQFLEKEQKHIDRVYGEGVWTGRDDRGRLYKDLDNTDLINELKGRSL